MPDSGTTKPTTLQRGQMRRRLRHQQRIREALLLDLGALVFELHRQGRREPELLQAKAAEVSAVDNEVRELAEALGADSRHEMLSPGVAGSCGKCGHLLSNDDRFCPNCGTPSNESLSGKGAVDEPQIDSSGNGSRERELDVGKTEALGAPPWAAEAAEATAREKRREDRQRRRGRRPPADN